jgi:hypothetical protein
VGAGLVTVKVAGGQAVTLVKASQSAGAKPAARIPSPAWPGLAGARS